MDLGADDSDLEEAIPEELAKYVIPKRQKQYKRLAKERLIKQKQKAAE